MRFCSADVHFEQAVTADAGSRDVQLLWNEQCGLDRAGGGGGYVGGADHHRIPVPAAVFHRRSGRFH